MRLLHFADLQLDTSFARLSLPPETGKFCRQALRDACCRLIDIAVQEEVDAVTVAGNLFAADTLHPETLQFLFQQFERLGRVPIYVAPGKTDPISRTSPYRLWRWPANVFIFDEVEPVPVRLGNHVTLWGAATSSQNDPSVLPAGFHAANGSIHLLLAHLPARNHEAGIAPLDVEAFQAAGFRCALLGGSMDFHFGPESGTRFAYPGQPESLGFGNQGTGGALLLHIDDDSLNVRHLPTRRLRFAETTVDVSHARSAQEVEELLRSLIPPDPQTVARFRIQGRLQPAGYARLPSVGRSLAAQYLYLDFRIEARPDFNLDELAGQRTVRGTFVRRLLDQRRSSGRAQQKIIDAAIDAGLMAFEDLEVPGP